MKRNMKNSYFNVLIIILMMGTLLSCEKSPKPLPRLLDLGADKCIPCKEMAPILEELKKDYAGVLEVEFIDVWKPENQQEAVKYGIKSIPTQIFYDSKGNELWRHVGFIAKEDILRKWKELGYDLKPVKTASVQNSCSDCTDCGDVEEGRTCE